MDAAAQIPRTRLLSPFTAFRELRHRLYSRFYERRFGVTTGGWILPKDLDYTSPHGKPYGAIGYEHIFWALDRLPFPAAEVEFVDIGAGKGRAMVAAASRPLRSVMGVELSPALAADAQRNLHAMRGRRAKSVELLIVNALEFAVPPTANVFYFFNPFDGPTMVEMVERLRVSFAAHPRKGFVIAFNHKAFDEAATGAGWVRKVYEGEFYPQFGCGLYEIG